MPGHRTATRSESIDDVVGVEVTIDGILVIADRLGLADFPVALGIRPNIAEDELRARVWDQVARDLTAQGVLDIYGQPHPAVADMVDTLARADRTLEARWWQRDGDRMVRFVVCRRGDRHLLGVRSDALLVLQSVAGSVGLAGMVAAVLGPAEPANIEPLTGLAADLAECRTATRIAEYGAVSPAAARAYADIIGAPTGWVEITASQRHAGGTSTQTEVAAGVIDSTLGRVVSLPRRVGGELYGSFLPGSPENLHRALESLLEFLPAGGWLDHVERLDTEYLYHG